MLIVVKTKAGYHLRVTAKNGKILLSSEKYKSRQGVNKLKAILKKGDVLKEAKKIK